MATPVLKMATTVSNGNDRLRKGKLPRRVIDVSNCIKVTFTHHSSALRNRCFEKGALVSLSRISSFLHIEMEEAIVCTPIRIFRLRLGR